MAFEIEALPRQQMFAWMMQMKLQQLVTRSGNDAGAARIGVELNGVAIVDQPERQRPVLIIDRTDITLDAVAQIDRRLLETELAHLEIGLQLSPFRWVAVTFVAPVRRCRAAMRRLVGGVGHPRLEAARARDCTANQHSAIDRHFRFPGSWCVQNQRSFAGTVWRQAWSAVLDAQPFLGKTRQVPGSQVRRHLPRDVKLLLDDPDLGFEV